MLVHIHQGGTLNTFCGAPLLLGTNVAWEDLSQSNCSACLSFFPAPPAASYVVAMDPISPDFDIASWL